MKDIKGKTAFITGAGNGIGLGMSVAFADAGMNIIMSDIAKATKAYIIDSRKNW